MADWHKIIPHIEAITSDELKAQYWLACEKAWLRNLQTVLGSNYRLLERDNAFLLSSLNDKGALQILNFMNRSLQRIHKTLYGIAEIPAWGKDTLLVFETQDEYYQYLSQFDNREGELAQSSGCYLNNGCGHFITTAQSLATIEPVIVHEMTHACVAHLPLPLWLNEGIAVNTEHQLTYFSPAYETLTPRQIMHKHQQFWNTQSIQRFWYGESFAEPGDTQRLSYDLARLLISNLANNWEAFQFFVLSAHTADAGQQSAQENFEIELGRYVCALLNLEYNHDWEPAYQSSQLMEFKF